MTQDRFSAVILRDSEPGDISAFSDRIDRFYFDVKAYVEDLGFDVVVQDSDEEEPVFTDLCIIHSDEEQLSKIASEATRSLDLRICEAVEIEDEQPYTFDYVLTDDMKDAIMIQAEHIKRLAHFQDQILKLADRMLLSS